MPSGDFVELTLGAGLTGTDLGDGVIELAATATGGDPADDAAVWLPLTTVVGGAPELVWDADDSLIPTLTPLA
jgi:hypothetical protein